MSSSPSSHFQTAAAAELEKDNIGGQRSKIDVIATILYICSNGSLKNHIVGKGNFSDSMANHYISILLYNELLTTYVDNENNARTYYRTTDKGRELINYYNRIQQLFTIKDKEHQLNETQTKFKSPANTMPSSETQLATKKLLIIDDEEDITSALKAGLERYGLNVDISNNPVLTLSNFKPGYYDLVILDIRMPNMDGFELYRKIKEIDPNVKVCFLTASELYYQEFREKEYNALDKDLFIRKPIGNDELIKEIKRLIGD